MQVSTWSAPSFLRCATSAASRATSAGSWRTAAARSKSTQRALVVTGTAKAAPCLTSDSTKANPASPITSMSPIMWALVMGTKCSASKNSPTAICCSSARLGASPASPARMRASRSVSRMGAKNPGKGPACQAARDGSIVREGALPRRAGLPRFYVGQGDAADRELRGAADVRRRDAEERAIVVIIVLVLRLTVLASLAVIVSLFVLAAWLADPLARDHRRRRVHDGDVRTAPTGVMGCVGRSAGDRRRADRERARWATARGGRAAVVACAGHVRDIGPCRTRALPGDGRRAGDLRRLLVDHGDRGATLAGRAVTVGHRERDRRRPQGVRSGWRLDQRDRVTIGIEPPVVDRRRHRGARAGIGRHGDVLAERHQRWGDD